VAPYFSLKYFYKIYSYKKNVVGDIFSTSLGHSTLKCVSSTLIIGPVSERVNSVLCAWLIESEKNYYEMAVDQ